MVIRRASNFLQCLCSPPNTTLQQWPTSPSRMSLITGFMVSPSGSPIRYRLSLGRISGFVEFHIVIGHLPRLPYLAYWSSLFLRLLAQKPGFSMPSEYSLFTDSWELMNASDRQVRSRSSWRVAVTGPGLINFTGSSTLAAVIAGQLLTGFRHSQ